MQLQPEAKPFIGEVVIYVQPSYEQPVNGTREHPAIVTRVWNDQMLNLMVMYDLGPIAAVGSVLRLDLASPNGAGWHRYVTAEASVET